MGAVQVLWFGVRALLGFRVRASWFWVQTLGACCGFRVQGLEFRI